MSSWVSSNGNSPEAGQVGPGLVNTGKMFQKGSNQFAHLDSRIYSNPLLVVFKTKSYLSMAQLNKILPLKAKISTERNQYGIPDIKDGIGT